MVIVPETSTDRGRQPLLALFAWLASVLTMLQWLLLVTGLLRWRLDATLGVTIVALSCLAATLLALSFLRPLPGPLPSPSPPGLGRTLGWLVALSLMAWTAAVWLRLWLLAAARPIYDWDGLYYHVPAIHAWARTGHLHWITTVEDVPFVNGYPMAVESLSFLLHRLTAGSALLDAGSLWFWPLGIVAIAVLARELGARGPLPWIAAAGLAMVPTIVLQGPTCYVDGASACALMGLLAVSALAERPGLHRSLRVGLLWGICAALVLSTKGTGLLFVSMLFVARLGWSMFRRRRPGRRRELAALALGLLVAASFGGIWNLRAAWYTGNPVHPVELRVGGKLLYEGTDARAATELNLPADLRALPQAVRPFAAWLQTDAPVERYDQATGMGYVWLLGGLPALLVLVGMGLRGRAHPAVLLLAMVGTLWLCIQPAPWWARFTLWLHGLGLPALAVAAQRIAWHPSKILQGGALLAACTLLSLGVVEAERALRSAQGMGWREAEAGAAGHYLSPVDYYLPGFSSRDGFRELLEAPVVGRSRLDRLATLLGGALAIPVGFRKIEVLGEPLDPPALARLQAHGLRWILWDQQMAGPPPLELWSRVREAHVYEHPLTGVLLALRVGPPEIPYPLAPAFADQAR
jgi:hypothetical protein